VVNWAPVGSAQFSATYRDSISRSDVALNVICDSNVDPSSKSLEATSGYYTVRTNAVRNWTIYTFILQSGAACIAPSTTTTQNPPPTSSTQTTLPTASNGGGNNNQNSGAPKAADNNINGDGDTVAIIAGAGGAGLAILLGVFCFFYSRAKRNNASQRGYEAGFPDDRQLHQQQEPSTGNLSTSNDIEEPLNSEGNA
jgi:hypothetical protein